MAGIYSRKDGPILDSLRVKTQNFIKEVYLKFSNRPRYHVITSKYYALGKNITR